MSELKTFVVWAKGYYQFAEYVNAETPSKARSKFYWRHADGIDMLGLSYIDLRSRVV